MKHYINQQTLGQAALSVAGVIIYIGLVSLVLFNGDRLFGSIQAGAWGPFLFLLLFVLSAAVMGLLLLGRPAYLFLNGNKQEAVTLLVTTVVGLFMVTTLAFIVVAVNSAASGIMRR